MTHVDGATRSHINGLEGMKKACVLVMGTHCCVARKTVCLCLSESSQVLVFADLLCVLVWHVEVCLSSMAREF